MAKEQPVARDKDAIRKAVILAAGKCFEEKGIARSTMPVIAAMAGVEVADIRAVFKNKGFLAFAVQAGELTRLTQEYLTNMPDVELAEGVKFIMRKRCEFVDAHHEQTTLFFRNGFCGREPWSGTLDNMIWQLSVEFATLFGKAVRRGEIRKETNTDIAVRVLVSIYLTGIVTMGIRAKKFDLEAVWNFIEPQVDMHIDSLKA